MKKRLLSSILLALAAAFLLTRANLVFAQGADFQVDSRGIPLLSFGDLLTFIIRLFFFIAGLAALIYGLWGAVSWITSGGGAEEVKAARDKIQAAVVGIFVLIIVLSLIVALEQVVFNRQLCFGLSCPVNFPGLLTFPMDAVDGVDACEKMGFTAGRAACAQPDPANPSSESAARCIAGYPRKINVPFGVNICTKPLWGHGVLCCIPR